MLNNKDLAAYGFARLRDQLFDAVRILWQRRMEEGLTFDDVASRLGHSKRWVKEKYGAPGQWTLRCAGELISVLDGEAEIKIPGLEDYSYRFSFGDSVQFNNEKYFVIGEWKDSADKNYIIVIANYKQNGMPVCGRFCTLLGSGFNIYCAELQEKFLFYNKGKLKGLFYAVSSESRK